MNKTSWVPDSFRMAARSPGRSRTGPESGARLTPIFARDDVRERGLAQPRRAEQQHVVQRLAPRARRLDEDLELAADLLLPTYSARSGPQRALELLSCAEVGLAEISRSVSTPHPRSSVPVLEPERKTSRSWSP